MKRTFLVTVDGEDAHRRWFDPDTIREHIEGWTDTTVTVTDITATHAKERQVLKAANDLASAERDRSALLISFALGDIRKATRELRALMEEK